MNGQDHNICRAVNGGTSSDFVLAYTIKDSFKILMLHHSWQCIVMRRQTTLADRLFMTAEPARRSSKMVADKPLMPRP